MGLSNRDGVQEAINKSRCGTLDAQSLFQRSSRRSSVLTSKSMSLVVDSGLWMTLERALSCVQQ